MAEEVIDVREAEVGSGGAFDSFEGRAKRYIIMSRGN